MGKDDILNEMGKLLEPLGYEKDDFDCFILNKDDGRIDIRYNDFMNDNKYYFFEKYNNVYIDIDININSNHYTFDKYDELEKFVNEYHKNLFRIIKINKIIKKNQKLE